MLLANSQMYKNGNCMSELERAEHQSLHEEGGKHSITVLCHFIHICLYHLLFVASFQCCLLLFSPLWHGNKQSTLLPLCFLYGDAIS